MTLFIAASAWLVSCDSPTDPVDLRKEIVTAVSNNVIMEIYHELDLAGQDLLAKIQAYRTNPNDANLAAAKAAWQAARTPFERGEAFEFGPLEDLGIKDDVDAWPLAIPTLEDSVIKGSFALTEANVKLLPTNVRGYHAIEYLLWGDVENNVPPNKSARALEFLEVMTKVTADKFTLLHDTWENSYLKTFTDRPGADALKQIVEALEHIVEEVGHDYLADPINKPEGARGWAESFFSNTSTQDFTDILAGVRAVYLGDYAGKSDKGVTDFVAEKDAAMDATIKQQIDAAYNAIVAIGSDFNGATKTDQGKALINNAITKCNELLVTFETLVHKDDWWK